MTASIGNKLQQTQVGRYFMLAALALSAMATVGCSVPPVNGKTARNEASSAYNDCVAILSTYGREAECSSASPRTTTTTYTQYSKSYATYTNLTGEVEAPSEEEAREAYLASLDDASLAEVTLEWKQMAEQAN